MSAVFCFGRDEDVCFGVLMDAVSLYCWARPESSGCSLLSSYQQVTKSSNNKYSLLMVPVRGTWQNRFLIWHNRVQSQLQTQSSLLKACYVAAIFRARRGGGGLVQWLKLPAWKVGDTFQVLKNCRDTPWPKSSVLGLRQPGLEFRIMCLEGSVISSSHHPQEVLLAQFRLCVQNTINLFIPTTTGSINVLFSNILFDKNTLMRI